MPGCALHPAQAMPSTTINPTMTLPRVLCFTASVSLSVIGSSTAEDRIGSQGDQWWAMTSTPWDDPPIARAHELVDKHLPREDATLWLNPPACMEAPGREGWRFWQPHFPQHRQLAARGWVETRERGGWGAAVLYASKHKEENWALLESLNSMLASDGEAFFAVPNDYGSKSYEAGLRERGRLLGYESGRKSRLYRLRATACEQAIPLERPQRNEAGFWSMPGLFSWKAVDRGSALLAHALSGEALPGPVGDLGAGWGYLSSTLAPSLELHLFESDRRGLDCAALNLEQRRLHLHWCDLGEGGGWPSSAPGGLATVISNPPFHMGKKEETALGREFARTAWNALPRGGAYWMVGNTHLAYPRLLATLFRDVEVKGQGGGFTVVKAVK